MKEDLLHYIWRYRLYDATNLKTTKGEIIEVTHPGTYNTDSGADFFNARLRIGDTLMAGNVEIHIHASDWSAHRHDQDAAYNNVILHVVYEGESFLTRSENGQEVPVLELKDHISQELLSRYELIQSNRDGIPCEKMIKSLTSDFSFPYWWDRLVIERLQAKTAQVNAMLKESVNDWDQVAFQMISSYFGASINKEPFSLLSRSLPLSVIHKHRNEPKMVEALLFGQAGLLEADFDDEYPKELKREYTYLRKLHALTPIESHSWKFFRTRPVNFPTIKIAQLAALMSGEDHLFSLILDQRSTADLRKIFDRDIHPYWQTHFQFDKPSTKGANAVGKMLMDVVLINAIVPLLFDYAQYKDDDSLRERSMALLSEIPAEKNAIIRMWQGLGLNPETASDTQALIQLKNQYCDHKRCLDCRIGHRLLQ